MENRDVQNKINDFITVIANRNLQQFCRTGTAIAGNNGPYLCEETCVRNTSHWLILYSYLWKQNHKKEYKMICRQMADYLVQEQKKSDSGAICCMPGMRFGHLNGLIGQAWVIEALVYAAMVFESDEYYETALAIFCSQKFDDLTGLWIRRELDSSLVDYDYAVNHQVWFAIAGYMLNGYRLKKEVSEQLDLFMDIAVNKHFRIYKNGLIKHFLDMDRPMPKSKIAFSKAKRMIKSSSWPLRNIDPNKFDPLAMEKGYHLFELYGYAILCQYCKNHPLYKRFEFKKALQYGLNIERLNKDLNMKLDKNGRFKDGTILNKYAYGYNAPAFEYPLIEYIFTGKTNNEVVMQLLEYQIQATYDEVAGKLSRNTYDAETLTARLYEYFRYLELTN